MKTNNKAGFSLIELLVALSILAVVAAIIVPRFLNVRQNAAQTTAQAQAKLVSHSIQQWMSLGGVCSDASGASQASASDILSFISNVSTSAVRSPAVSSATKVNNCYDSVGTFGSVTISLQISSTGDSTKQGFNFGGGTAAYNDGAGTIYDISIDSKSGSVTLTPEAANMVAGTPTINA